MLISRLMKAGYKVKGYDGQILKLGPFEELEKTFHQTYNTKALYKASKLREVMAGCDFVLCIDYFPSNANDDKSIRYDNFKLLVDIAKDCGVKRLIHTSNPRIDEKNADPEQKTLCTEYLQSVASDDFIALVVQPATADSYSARKKLNLIVNILTKNANLSCKTALLGGEQNPLNFHSVILQGQHLSKWYKKYDKNVNNLHIEGMADLCLFFLEHSKEKLHNTMSYRMLTYKTYLRQFFVVRKLLQYIKNPKIFLLNVGFIFQAIKRLCDVFLMMVLMHVWPEQAYRFSTRKVIPPPQKRFALTQKQEFPSELIPSRTSDIPKSKHANIILRGISFEMDMLKYLDPPIYLSGFWIPIKTKKDVIYLHGDSRVAYEFTKLGIPTIYVEANNIDEEGSISPFDSNANSPWYNQIFDKKCKRISHVLKYHHPYKHLYANPGSGLGAISAMRFFAEKIDVYGWDFHLKSSPDNMSYWELFFNLYNLRLDIGRSRNHFEAAIFNLYYGYHLSKLPNINVHGYMGQLSKHEKLIRKIERSLFR
ncbi:MAG: hypothetical protein K8S27_13715 [Candidatus Omnitrophica bacterium]|nr:hypothetical protein [Candidatus Omnitrophota bacterium]